MDKGVTPSLFVNDGSFMERFRQLQQEKDKDKGSAADESRPSKVVSGTLTPTTTGKTSAELKANDARKVAAASGSKLAFSLKQKSKIVAPPVKLGADEDEDEADAANVAAAAPTKRQKLGQPDPVEESYRQVDVANSLSSYQHWWKEMFNERIGICGTPATRVICIPLFMLSVLISFISDMQPHLPQPIQQ